MKLFSRRRSGFTIIELSIYTGLVSIFLITLLQMFLSTLDLQLETQASAGVDQDGRFLMSRLNYDLHRTSQIISPSSPGQTANSLQLNIGGVTYTYSLVGSNLQLTRPGASGVLNSSETTVPFFTVTRLEYPSPTCNHCTPGVRINLSLESTTISQQNPQIRSYQTTVTLR